MTAIIKWTVGGGTGFLLMLAGFAIFYPEKTSEAKQSIEAAGAVAVDQLIVAMEARVGRTAVVLEHYKTAYKAKRASLVQLKTLHAEAQRKASDAAIRAAELRSKGNESAAIAKEAEKQMFDSQAARLSESTTKAEAAYKEFDLFFKRKKIELDTLRAKTEMLKGELTALSGGDAGFAMQRAAELEEEIKKTCSRLESEIQVQELDNNIE